MEGSEHVPQQVGTGLGEVFFARKRAGSILGATVIVVVPLS